KIMVKPAGGGKRGDWARMVSGRYLGTHNRFGSILAMTDAGVVVGTGFHTVPEDQRLPPVVLVAPAPGPGGEVPVERPEEHQGGEAPEAEGHSAKGRAWPVRRTMMQKYGSTPGCQGCHTINTGGALVQASHSEECRVRMKRRIAEDVKKDEEKMKKQKDEDEREIARRAKKRVAEEEANDEARAEAEPSSSSRGPDAGEASPKRKGGEQGARDIEDVLRDMEEDASGQAGSRRMEAEEILAEAGSKEAASIVASLGALDVLEVFSPQRVTKELKRFGMRDGAAVDLEEMKPDGSERWNLDRPEDQKEVLEMIQVEEPWLLTSSPPCTTFSPLRNVSNGKRDPGVVQEEEELGKARMRTAMKCCKQQREQGAFYLHEHPKPSTSWKMPEVEEEVNRDDTYLVQSPMCRWGMKMEDREGEILHVRKETLWLTNSRRIAEELEGVCENVLQGREVHRHVHLVGGGRAKAAQVYPKELVEAILRGLRKELRERGEISAVEEQLSGPTPDEYVEQEELYKEEFGQFVDDVTGTELPAHLVKAARKEELGWLHKEGVYVKVPRRICEGKGMKPLQLKWLDINKGDATQVKVRSRLVAKEVRKAKRPEDRLRAEETFAATPPLEAVNLLLSL
ncbi:MAG: hypothetical protein NXI25_26465, partial [bacterium]|nr:hypothetical protein [bacterium]